MSKYGKNFTAYRSLSALFDTLGVLKVYAVDYEQIKAHMKKLHQWTTNFFSTGTGDYMHRLMLHETGPLLTFDRNITNFLNGDILEYGKSISKE